MKVKPGLRQTKNINELFTTTRKIAMIVVNDGRERKKKESPRDRKGKRHDSFTPLNITHTNLMFFNIVSLAYLIPSH